MQIPSVPSGFSPDCARTELLEDSMECVKLSEHPAFAVDQAILFLSSQAHGEPGDRLDPSKHK